MEDILHTTYYRHLDKKVYIIRKKEKLLDMIKIHQNSTQISGIKILANNKLEFLIT